MALRHFLRTEFSCANQEIEPQFDTSPGENDKALQCGESSPNLWQLPSFEESLAEKYVSFTKLANKTIQR